MLTGSVEQPVQIDCDELQLFADKVEMFRADGRVVADGHVVFVSGTNRISAERVEFNTKTRTGTFYNASGTAIMRQGTPAQSAGEQEPYAFFWGDELHKVGPTKYKIVRGGFTACVQPTPRWEVSSGTLTLNLDDYVLLTNAIFRVKGVPLLYLPVFYYPMQEDDRATGFILPDLRHRNPRGAEVEQRLLLGARPKPRRHVRARLVHEDRSGCGRALPLHDRVPDRRGTRDSTG